MAKKTAKEVRNDLLVEASVLGHAEAKTKQQKFVAGQLVGEGKLVKGGNMSNGGEWFVSPETAKRLG